MNPMIRLTAAAAALAAAGAFAQPAPPFMAASQVLGGPMRHDLIFAAGPLLEQERVVQGAPYCADAVHEIVQPLADGNRIVQKQDSRQCRDGAGRTRQEVTTRGGRVNVFLRDPVAKEAWMLDPDRKLAVRIDAPRQPLAPLEPHMWQRMMEWSQHLRDHLRQTLRLHGGSAAAASAATPGPLEPVRISMRGMGPLPGGMPPPFAFHPRLLGPRGPGTTTLLPDDTIDGLRADGKRTVWTIEAGRIGNEKPITIVNETWSSPELGITLRTHEVDPLSGEDSFTVRNVVRGEPDPELFRVPAEYAKVSPPDLRRR
jgi:hypothetical protein